jgi:hypothetical protein
VVGGVGGREHGGRGTRGWKKLHRGVDRAGMIVAHALPEATVDDASVGVDLIGAAAGPVASVTGDAAYDAVAFYEAASAGHAQVVAPPTRTAKVSCRGPRRVRAIARPCRERLLPLQVDHWRWASGPSSTWPGCRGKSCVPHRESDGRAWQARVVSNQSVTRPWVERTTSPE